MARALLLAVLFVVAGLAGCLVPGGGSGRSGDLVRIVAFAPDQSLFEQEPNDAADVFAALADTRFEYTHNSDAVDPDDVTVAYTDEDGRDREVPLSRFTDLDEVGRGDKVVITDALLTSRMDITHGDDKLASRGGPALDWLEAGGYPLPFAMRGGLAVWDLDGRLDLDAGFDAIEVVSEDERWTTTCEPSPDDPDGYCQPQTQSSMVTTTTRFTDALAQGQSELDGTLKLDSVGSALQPELLLGMTGLFSADATFNVHLKESSTDPEDEGMDADFGFSVEAQADGDGSLRFRFDRDGALDTVGGEGELDASGSVTSWDDEHPRSAGYSPGDVDDFDVHFPYEETSVPFGDNPVSFVAQALSDLWRMDLAPGDEFTFSTKGLFGEDGENDMGFPTVSIAIRVVELAEKEVEAGTFDALRVETSTVIEVPDAGTFERFELPTFTTWVDDDSGLPVAVEESVGYHLDQADFAPLFAKASEWDEGTSATGPQELHVDLDGRTLMELQDYKDGFHMAPMASVIVPMMSLLSPAFGFFFGVPFGGFGGYEDGGDYGYDEPAPYGQDAPMVSFYAQPEGEGGRVVVVRAGPGVPWTDLGFVGDAACMAPYGGDVEAGQEITCMSDGEVRIVHWPSNTLLFVGQV